MIRLELNPDERAALIELLDSALSDLRMEISDTDLMDFKEVLKSRREILTRIRATLETKVAVP